jgi:SAM-dependent methyltransferase
MRRQAEAHDYMPNVRFQDGFSHRTGLPDESADIVTCSQSLHWMEPESTFAEVTRILRPGGVFAAYDYDWPPTMDWEAERAFEEFMNRIDEIWRELGIKGEMKRWRKEEHLGRMERSGRFRYVKEFFIHSAETGTADRLIGLVLSQAYVSRVLALGLSEDQIGLEELRQVAKRTLGNEGKAWYFSYRVRIGVK